MSAGVLLQAVLTGLSVGAVYGLVGCGFSLLAGLARIYQLAHGDLVVAAVLGAVLVVVGRTPVAAGLGVGGSVSLVVLALALGVGLSLLVFELAVRPALRRGDAVAWVAGTVAAGLLLREGLGLLLPEQGYAVPDPLRLDQLTATGVLTLPGGGSLPVRTLGVLAVGLVSGLLLDRLVVGSSTGRALRAVTDDVDAAALCGVNVRRAVLVGVALAGLLAAVAGLLDAPSHPVGAASGVMLGLKGITAALIGRLGSLRGALLGGLALGVIEQVAVAAPGPGPAWQDVLPLAVLLLVLALRPDGLRGRRPAEVQP
ncbi:MAG: branched-chain amino acid transport system permease protein [Frankiales bacterium]|nr:branched-chain amino acid transport system permease protein [Frankiales bacterium]